jgi:hypothetical protein
MAAPQRLYQSGKLNILYFTLLVQALGYELNQVDVKSDHLSGTYEFVWRIVGTSQYNESTGAFFAENKGKCQQQHKQHTYEFFHHHDHGYNFTGGMSNH